MKKEITFKTELKVSIDTLESLLVSAFEGGSNYWYEDLMPLARTSNKIETSAKFYDDLITNGFSLKSNGSRKKLTVTPDKFKEALALMVEKESMHWNDVVKENADATTGDVFLQLCCFGEVIYG